MISQSLLREWSSSPSGAFRAAAHRPRSTQQFTAIAELYNNVHDHLQDCFVDATKKPPACNEAQFDRREISLTASIRSGFTVLHILT